MTDSGIFDFKDYFIGIGIARYKHDAYFTNLSNPVRDIEAIQKVLIEKYGLLPENSLCLRNEEATQRSILETFKNMSRKVNGKDRLIILFSGHGFFKEDLREGYWIPYEADQSESTWIPEGTIITHLRQFEHCRHILLISDSCFSGSFITAGKTAGFQTMESHQLASRIGFASGRKLVSDGERGKNSPFATEIIEALRKNNNTALLVSHLRTLVFSALERAGQFKQTPTIGALSRIDGHEGGEFVFWIRSDSDEDLKLALQQAKEQGTLEAYRAFLVANAGTHSIYLEEAQGIFQDIVNQLIRRAKSDENVETLNEFVVGYKEFPNYAEKARKAIREIEQVRKEKAEKAAWDLTCRENSVDAYEAFENHYPGSIYIPENRVKLQKAVERRSYEQVLASTDLDYIEQQLINKVVSDDYIEVVRDHFQNLSFLKLEASPSLGSVNEFLRRFAGQIKPIYQATVHKWQQHFEETIKYEEALKINTTEAWLHFFSQSPSGKHFEAARSAFIAACEYKLFKLIAPQSPARSYSRANQEDFDNVYRQISQAPFWADLAAKSGAVFTQKYEAIKSNDLIANADSPFVVQTLRYLRVFPETGNAKILWSKLRAIARQQGYKQACQSGKIDAFAAYWLSPHHSLPLQNIRTTLKKTYLVNRILSVVFAGFLVFLCFAKLVPFWQIRYAKNLVLQKDEPKRALQILLKYPDDPVAQSYIATAYFDSGNMGAAIPYYEKAMQNGINRAFFTMGYYYIAGFGQLIKPDTSQGIKLLYKAAELKEPRAYYYLADFLEKGLGKYLPVDKSQASICRKNAALLGFHDIERSTDKNAALNWLRIAAINGDAQARLDLGGLFARGDGVDTSKTRALYWYKHAASDNLPKAFRELGNFFSSEQNYKEAFNYFELAVKAGDTASYAYLGNAYRSGNGVDKNLQEAIKYYRTVLQHNPGGWSKERAEACLNMAEIYMDSIKSSDKYCKEEMYWLKKAFEYTPNPVSERSFQDFDYVPKEENKQSVKLARYLGDLYYYGYCGARDIEEAGKYYIWSLNEQDTAMLKTLAAYYYKKSFYKRAAHLYRLLPDDYPAKNLGVEAVRNICLIWERDTSGTLPAKKVMNWLEQMVMVGHGEFVEPFARLKYMEVFTGPKEPSQNRPYIAGAAKTELFKEKDLPYRYINRLKKQANAGFPEIYALLGWMYEVRSRERKINGDSALYFYRIASSFNEPYATFRLGSLYKEGDDRITGKNYPEAMRLLAKTIEINKDKRLRWQTYLYLGQICVEKQPGNYTEAVNYFQKVLEIDKNDPDALNNLCNIYYYYLNNPIAAKEFCSRAAGAGVQEAREKCRSSAWPYGGLDPFDPSAKKEEKGFWEKLGEILK